MALPSIKFAAPIIRAGITTLEAQMPGQVAAFNAEPANTVELDEPQTYHFGGQDLLVSYAYPQIEVGATSGDTGNWAINRSEVDHDVTMNVAVWIQGEIGDVPDLYERVLGTCRCVIECLSPNNAFGPGIEIRQQKGISWRCDVIPWDPTHNSPAQGRDFQKWMGSGLIVFRLEDVEHFT